MRPTVLVLAAIALARHGVRLCRTRCGTRSHQDSGSGSHLCCFDGGPSCFDQGCHGGSRNERDRCPSERRGLPS